MESDDGDLTTSDSLSSPASKRRRSSGAGKHRKSSKCTCEFKWLEKVEIDGQLGMQYKLCKKHGKKQEGKLVYRTMLYH